MKKRLLLILLFFSCSQTPTDLNDSNIKQVMLPIVRSEFKENPLPDPMKPSLYINEPTVSIQEEKIPSHSFFSGLISNKPVTYNEKIETKCLRLLATNSDHKEYTKKDMRTDSVQIKENSYSILYSTLFSKTPTDCDSNYRELEFYTFFPGLSGKQDKVALMSHESIKKSVYYYWFAVNTCKGSEDYTSQKYIYHFGIYTHKNGKRFLTPVLKLKKDVEC